MFSQISLANSIEKCPSTDAIRAAADTLTIMLDTPPPPPPYWSGFQVESFDTNVWWAFTVSLVEAATEAEAADKIKTGFKSLVLVKGPYIGRDGTYCDYQTAEGYSAQAISAEGK